MKKTLGIVLGFLGTSLALAGGVVKFRRQFSLPVGASDGPTSVMVGKRGAGHIAYVMMGVGLLLLLLGLLIPNAAKEK